MFRWCVCLLLLTALLALSQSKSQTQVNLNYGYMLRGLGNTPVKVAKAQGLTSFVNALQASSLRSLLHTEASYTIFAPSNAAFNNLINPTALDLVTNAALSRRFNQIMKYHVVLGAFPTAALTNGTRLTTLGGGQLTVVLRGTNVTLLDDSGNSATITTPNVPVRQGSILHVIDRVLTPTVTATEFLRTDARFTNLWQLLDRAGFLDALDSSFTPVTLFAPTDNAIATTLPVGVTLQTLKDDPTTLRSVLLYHIWGGAQRLTGRASTVITMGNGMKATFNNTTPLTITDARNAVATISTPDIAVSNGFVNPINRVLSF